MNYIDIILGLLLLVGIIRGLMRGFVFEIAVLGSMFLGCYAAFHFAAYLTPVILKIGKMNPRTVAFVSALAMFILVAVGIFFLARLFEKLVNIAALGIFNKILGAVFGLLKYVFITGIVLYFFNQADSRFHLISADKKAESRLYYPILHFSTMLLPVLDDLKKEAVQIVKPDSK